MKIDLLDPVGYVSGQPFDADASGWKNMSPCTGMRNAERPGLLGADPLPAAQGDRVGGAGQPRVFSNSPNGDADPD